MTQTKQPQLCWICGNNVADTGEHRSKRTDIKQVLGTATQSQPLFFSTNLTRNRRIQSTNSVLLRFKTKICGPCNNARTQTFDRSWEQLSASLRSLPKGATFFRASKVFPYKTQLQMLNAHLYFLKIFGCYALDAGLDIDIASFGKCLREQKAHSNFFLRFLMEEDKNAQGAVGTTEIETLFDGSSCAYATFIYFVGRVDVMLIYNKVKRQTVGMKDAWHPSGPTKRISLGPLE